MAAFEPSADSNPKSSKHNPESTAQTSVTEVEARSTQNPQENPASGAMDQTEVKSNGDAVAVASSHDNMPSSAEVAPPTNVSQEQGSYSSPGTSSPPAVTKPEASEATASTAVTSDSQVEREKDKMRDKDEKPEEGTQSSTTLSATHTQTRSRAPRRKASKRSSTQAADSSTNNNTKASSTRAPKRSFFSRLFLLVPCIGSSSDAHPVEIDGLAMNNQSKPTAHAAPTETKKPSTQTEKDTQVPAVAQPEVNQSEKAIVADPSIETALESPAPLTIVPPVLSDPDVILPPTPIKQLLPQSETEGVTSGAVQPPGSTGEGIVAAAHEHLQNHSRRHSREHDPQAGGDGEPDESDGTSFTEDEDIDDPHGMDAEEDEEDRLILNGGAGIPIGPDGLPKPLLPPMSPAFAGRKCLILDLDETLVHSSFKSIAQADYVVPVEIEYHWHNVYVIKRPGVDNFLKKMGEIYEVVVFTASLSKYADPVLDKLDIHQVVSHRLFRESCYNHKGNYVKDLSQLGRPIADTIILDNSPASYIFHPNNAVPVSSWFNDPHDTELTDLVPFLSDLSGVDDVRGVLDGGL